MDYKLIIGERQIEGLQRKLGASTWPELMQHDKLVNACWPNLYTDFLDIQFALFDYEKLVGIGNMMYINWEQPFNLLPDGGVRWAMEKACQDVNQGIQSNLFVGIQILIEPTYQSRGISYHMVKTMQNIAASRGVAHVAVPVRPTLKSRFPLIPMDAYINWNKKDGLPFDPWLRVHLKLGGKIVAICHESMFMEGTVSEWEDWSDSKFPGSGQFTVEQALSPITIDLEKNKGTYVEPNVWIIHEKEGS
jgi:hypothetical protein